MARSHGPAAPGDLPQPDLHDDATAPGRATSSASRCTDASAAGPTRTGRRAAAVGRAWTPRGKSTAYWCAARAGPAAEPATTREDPPRAAACRSARAHSAGTGGSGRRHPVVAVVEQQHASSVTGWLAGLEAIAA